MTGASAQDESALATLYDATSPFVFGIVLRILGDRASAEDVVLEVYAQVWRQAARYDRSRGSVMAWLMTLARTRALDVLRSRARRNGRENALDAGFDPPDPTPDPGQTAVGVERANRVRSALQELPREQRQAIEAAYFKGMSHTEVATALGQPLGTVKTRIRTGLAALRRALVET